MKIHGRRCQTCGHLSADREITDNEACACGSRICLLANAEVCITTNKPRLGTQRDGVPVVKDQQAPRMDRMMAAAGVRKG